MRRTGSPWGWRGYGNHPTPHVGLLLALAVLLIGPATAVADFSLTDGGPLNWSNPVRVDNIAPFSSAMMTRAVSCPTTSFCMGVGTVNGQVVTTTAPASTTTAWTPTQVPGAFAWLDEVACPTSSLCVVSGTTDTPKGAVGALWVSTDPGDHPSTWLMVYQASQG